MQGVRVPPALPLAATPPPTPSWTPPFGRAQSPEPPGEITGSHMKGNFSQAEMELKAASHRPRLPPLCQARLLSSWCWKGACDTQEGVEGQSSLPTWLLFLLLETMAEVTNLPHLTAHSALEVAPSLIPKALTHLKPGPTSSGSPSSSLASVLARLKAAVWEYCLPVKWMTGVILQASL